MDLLQNRSEIPIRGGALHALGRMRYPAAFPVLIAYLALPEFRELTIHALSMYGDARAIPYLEPYLQDTTEAAQPDERGATICIYHLANDAIRYLRAETLRKGKGEMK
jgi:HEAT repeat protein